MVGQTETATPWTCRGRAQRGSCRGGRSREASNYGYNPPSRLSSSPSLPSCSRPARRRRCQDEFLHLDLWIRTLKRISGPSLRLPMVF